MPAALHDELVAYAEANEMSISEATSDLVAAALGSPLPSTTLPRAKTRTRRQREELALGLTA